MSTIIKIGIVDQKGNDLKNVNSILVKKGQGIVGDRHFKLDNDIREQITLIEHENIIFFNELNKIKIQPLNFRRNIITQNIKLNNLVGKEFSVGEVKLKAHDLCRPCKYLQDKLNQYNLVKELIHKGGLRCEILTNGKINVGDIIK